jgi:hypothetical protein
MRRAGILAAGRVEVYLDGVVKDLSTDYTDYADYLLIIDRAYAVEGFGEAKLSQYFPFPVVWAAKPLSTGGIEIFGRGLPLPSPHHEFYE